MIIPWKHQIQGSIDAAEVIRKHMIVYLAWEERTGKSLTSLLTAELLDVQNVLILTKKKALSQEFGEGPGWVELLKDAKPLLTKHYAVTNYHAAHKLKKVYDLIILDESHNYISAYPKIGATKEQLKEYKKKGKRNTNIYDHVKRLCSKVPIIYLSATPHAQGTQLLYHQLSVSSWSPWRGYPDFYAWHKIFGIPNKVKVHSFLVENYAKAHTLRVMKSVEHLFIRKTRKELGFDQEPVDVVHYIELSASTKQLYNTLIKDKYTKIDGMDLVCDTTAKYRAVLHMVEGGTVKIDVPTKGKLKINYVQLGNSEKLDYIMEKWGDSKDVAIMYNFIGEGIKLRAAFKHATILQATSFAEGVSLAHVLHLVIYSQDYSTARHTQRRARQCNKLRTDPINVNFLLVKKAVSEQCYKTVSINKKNFVDSMFKRIKL